MTYRTGRHEHRCIRVQLGPEPHDDDPLTGTMDTPELGRLVVELLNTPEGSALASYRRVEALHQPAKRDGPTPYRCLTCIAGYNPRDGSLAYAAWPCATYTALVGA